MTGHEKTVVLIKPDALQRGLVGEIVRRFERKGLKIVGMKMIDLGGELVENWYSHIKDEDFFPRVRDFMTSTPVVAVVIEGFKAVEVVRRLAGIERKGYAAEMGSIRGDFSMSGGQNVVHSSDSVESAKRELELLFNKNELFEYESATECLIYDADEKVNL
ncbi:nucleoside-diphosphate kinase [Candidatus Amesbacteria bacterium]|nr:nucleoside-diphosphate kinase [Candidatus Amesbacteria bacterium]MBI2587508.1 nucleoside-diphosphate kinase [Candidatus Amesbacteria bacterium]